MRTLGAAVCVLVLASALAHAQTTYVTTGEWSERIFAVGPPMSTISGSGKGWSLTAEKLSPAVPGPAGWQWQTLYENGTLVLNGLGGITDTVTGLTFTNLTWNYPTGLPKMFRLSGSGTLKYGSTFSLVGSFVGLPRTAAGNDSLLVYGNLTSASFTVNPIEVNIAVKPWSDPSPINLKSEGVVPVAILGSEAFDVSKIDQSSLLLAGASPKEKGKSGKIGSIEDLDGDMFMDLVVHFPTQDMLLECWDTEVYLTGLMDNGEPIFGMHQIWTPGCQGPKYAVSLQPIPEPVTLWLLSLGWLALPRKRKE